MRKSKTYTKLKLSDGVSLAVQMRVSFSLVINYIECSIKFILKAGIKELIVNAPLVSRQSKNTNNAKTEVRFEQLIRDL
jgi:hypothetical protein